MIDVYVLVTGSKRVVILGIYTTQELAEARVTTARRFGWRKPRVETYQVMGQMVAITICPKCDGLLADVVHVSEFSPCVVGNDAGGE